VDILAHPAGNIRLPRHDMPNGAGERSDDLSGQAEATLTAWFGDNPETVTSFALTV